MPARIPDSDPVAATPSALPFDSILAQCRDLVCERLDQALSGMLDNVDDALSALIRDTRDPEAKKLYMQTKDKALAQREAIEKQFRARYLREFQERSNRVKKIGDSFSEIDLSSLELELVGDDDLDETLKFNAMATKLRQYCDEELIALDQRVGVLLGDASLQAEDNPFTPQAICDAYKQTCRQLDSNVEVRMVLLKLFDDHVLDDIRAVYKALNALLVRNSILPKIRLSMRKEGSKPPTSGAEAVAQPPGGEQDFFTVLQNLLASNVKPAAQPAGAGGTGVPAQGTAGTPGFIPAAGVTGADAGRALQGTELLGLLTRIQLGDVSGVTGNILPMMTSAGEPGVANVLRELKGTSVGTGMSQLDVMTLDIMAMVFDQLFDDRKIPVSVKGLIGRLQIPMLKVAISDKTFFSKKTHPARQLLDTLGEISSRLPADFNPSNELYGRLETILQELIVGFEDDMGIFDVARERLQTLITEEDQRVEQETLSTANQIEQKERLALAKTVAQAEIKARVRAGDLPLPVIEFLVQQWVQLLMIVQVKDGEGSDAWKNALETMDLLIWSVEPKYSVEDRRDLASIVPELLKRLMDGLKQASVEDDVRRSFFGDLRKLHSHAIGKPGAGKAAVTQDAGAADNSAKSDSAPASEPAPVPAIEVAPGPAAESAPVLAIEVAPAPAAEPAPVPKIDIELAPAAESAPVPTIEVAPAPVAESAPVPKIDIELAPAAESAPLPTFELAPLPAAQPEPVPTFELAPAPAAESAPERTIEIARAPVVQPAPVPTFDLAFPAVEPAPLPDLEFSPAPAAEPAPSEKLTPPPPLEFTPSSAAHPAPVPAATPAPAPQPVPAAEPAPAAQTVPAARPGDTPAVKPASAPGKGVRPVLRSPDAPRSPSRANAVNLDSLGFTAPITVQNPFGDGKVEVDDLDFTVMLGAGIQSARPAATADELPANLKIGIWVGVREKNEKDTRRSAKLTYISPLKTRYLFVDRHGKASLDCSRTELARRFRDGEVVIMDEVPEVALFDRITEGLVGKLGGPKAPR